MPKRSQFPMAAAAFSLSVTHASATEIAWERYRNARFGVVLEYPQAPFTSPLPADNGDGIRLTGEGVTLAVWGSHNALGEPPYRSLCGDGCPGETYKVDRARVGITSSVAAGIVSYGKCLAVGGDLHCFLFTYPATRKGEFDAAVARMSRSLR